jgi:hypothetical protein
VADEIIPTPTFTNKAKRLTKKFKTLFDSIEQLETRLLANPRLGDPYGKIYIKYV